MTHRLDATAAAWSLHAALHALTARATAEDKAAQIAAAALEDHDGLRSPTWGGRRALGGHSDPTATAYLVGGLAVRANRYADLADDVTGQLHSIAQHLGSCGDPLDRIRLAVPLMSDRAAEATTTALTHLDGIVRRLLRIGPDREPVPGPCPVCDVRERLYVQTPGPVEAWTVVCGACDGIWPRAAVLTGAVTGGAR